MEKIRFIDTFAGIGGFHRGIIQALGEENAECVGAVEWDKNARQAYSANFPDVHVYEDITKLNYEDLPDHDLLTGGFPCQPFSIARNKNNKTVVDDNDDRAQLYKSLIAICKVKKPKYIFFENVARLVDMTTSDNNRVIDLIKNELGELGYTVIYGKLDSKEFGVPQQRNRVFILGTTTGQQLTLPESFGKPKTINDILEKEVDDKYLLKNKNWCKITLREDEGKEKPRTRLDKLKENYLYKQEKDGKKINRVSEVNGDTPSGLSRQNERLYSIHGVSPTLTTFFPPHVNMGSDNSDKWRSLTPRECLRVQGFPDDHIPHPKDQAAYKQTGNAVCVNVIQAIISHNKEKFLSGVRGE